MRSTMKSTKISQVAPIILMITVVAQGADSVPERAQAFLSGFQGVGTHFEANEGQLPSDARFCFRGDGYRLDLVNKGIELRLPGNEVYLDQAMRIRFVGAHPEPRMMGSEKLPFSVMRWETANGTRKGLKSFSTFASVDVDEIYHDIDMRYYINQGRLEYDFILAPGADPTGIELKLDGAKKISLREDGGLQIAFPIGTILQHKPDVYQEIEGKKAPVEAQYAMRGERSVGFQVGNYDPSFPLVIDPVLTVRIDGH